MFETTAELNKYVFKMTPRNLWLADVNLSPARTGILPVAADVSLLSRWLDRKVTPLSTEGLPVRPVSEEQSWTDEKQPAAEATRASTCLTSNLPARVDSTGRRSRSPPSPNIVCRSISSLWSLETHQYAAASGVKKLFLVLGLFIDLLHAVLHTSPVTGVKPHVFPS